MPRALRPLAALAATLTLSLGLAGCGAGGAASTTAATTDTGKPLVIMADVKPHSELLKKTQELGLLGDTKITIKEISGDVDVNQLTNAGDVDANFFQHTPYLKDWNAQHNASLVAVASVHIEPLGLYSKKVATVADTPAGAVIAIPLDATNQARALFLLQDAGLITLNVKATDANLDYSQVTQKNITGNPKNIKFRTVDRPQLAATLDDPQITLSIVNGNYALEAGLVPAKDAKFLEKAANNPYVNVLVTTEKLKDDPRVKKVAAALESPQIAQYIKDTYQGSVLPAKG